MNLKNIINYRKLTNKEKLKTITICSYTLFGLLFLFLILDIFIFKTLRKYNIGPWIIFISIGIEAYRKKLKKRINLESQTITRNNA